MTKNDPNKDKNSSNATPTTTVFSTDSNLLHSIYFSHMHQNLTLLEEDETPMSAYTGPTTSTTNNSQQQVIIPNNETPSSSLAQIAMQQQQNNGGDNTFVDLDGFGSIGALSQFDIPLSINITGYQLTHKEEKKAREKEREREVNRMKKLMEQRKTNVMRDEDEMEKKLKNEGLSFFRNGFMVFTNSSETELDEGSERGRHTFSSHDDQEEEQFDMYDEYRQDDQVTDNETDLLEEQLIYFYPSTVSKTSQLHIIGYIQSYLIFTDSFHPLVFETLSPEENGFDNNSISPPTSADNTKSLLTSSLKAEATAVPRVQSKESNHPVNMVQFNHSKMAIVRYYNLIYCLCAPISTPNYILHENLRHILDSFAFIYGTYNIKQVLSDRSSLNKREKEIEAAKTEFYTSHTNEFESSLDVFEDIIEGPFPVRSIVPNDNHRTPWIASPYNPIVSNIYKKRPNTERRWNSDQEMVLDDLNVLIKMYTVSQKIPDDLPIKAMTQRIFPHAIPYAEVPEKNIFIKAMTILNQLQDSYGSTMPRVKPNYNFNTLGVSLSRMVQKQLENLSINEDTQITEERGSLIGSAMFFESKGLVALNNLDEKVVQFILFRLKCIEKNLCEYQDRYDESFDAEIVSSPMTKFTPLNGVKARSVVGTPQSDNPFVSTPDSSHITPIPLRKFKTPGTPVNTQSPYRSNAKSNSTSNLLTSGATVSPLVKSLSKSSIGSARERTLTPENRSRSSFHESSPGGLSNASVQSNASTTYAPSPLPNENSAFGINAYMIDDWSMYETTAVQDLQYSEDEENPTNSESKEKISRINLDYNMFIISGDKESEFIVLSEEDQIDYLQVYLNSNDSNTTSMKKHALITYRYRDLSLCLLWEFKESFNWRCDLNDCIIKIRTEMKPILRQISRKMDRSSYTNMILAREESAPYKLNGNVRYKRAPATNNNGEQTTDTNSFCLMYDEFNSMATTTNISSKTFFVNVAKARNTYLNSTENQQVEWWNEEAQQPKTGKAVTKLFLKNDRDGFIYSKQLFGSQIYYYKQQQQPEQSQKTAAYFALSKLETNVRETVKNEFKINLL
ncbi:predicted protein [Naegleria gruberi]|uniref:Predicted protein n=1 Tax=Naegleria gruberi TaxID=5762 RepID=D2VKM2_NAEGR|nr:uncharacterized protein NAEGRDRAFT_69443 [Naegleria gruberi]EFC42712.1 predicted protein [Naegleria gruberi]|eukprot:XP_002675456.1 predicted protein [Naegleria gruberi strain NEG-M]